MNPDSVSVCIVFESRHGGTAGIAQALGARFTSAGCDVSIVNPADVQDLDADIVVIGSAVYLGKWLKRAVRFVERRTEDLADRSVWLFSSGPLDDDPTSQHGLDDDHVAHLMATTGAQAHHVFPGRLDRSELGPVESLLARSVHAPEGDFRDWQDVDEWADQILAASRSQSSERGS